MTMTDISLNWVLLSTVLLAGALVAVVMLARGREKNQSEDTAQPDSWERMEERRRRKETVYATASYLLLFCCAGVAAALSFHGLVGFGRENLGLSGGWEYLVPFGLDGAAMFSAVIAVREASHGDASLGSRLLVWLFACAAAWFNWVHAPRGDDHAGAPQFFAGMSLSAAILFDRALKQTRRAALREQGLVPRPLPQIRFVRWLRAPRETYGAWSLMLLEGVRTLDEAVDEVREERRRQDEERQRKREQDRLERARLKALRRQHPLWHRGRADQPVEVEVAAAAPPRPRAALEPAVEGTIEDGTAEDARTARADLTRAEPTGRPGRRLGRRSHGDAGDGDHRAGGRRGTGDAGEEQDDASPRLDSLEEKLAAIERQFG
ncbi:DUF2637 domain-containing protein [Streptomyces sp. JJ36]|uniref:DUF2637 domain-containing protein n=1 Tax=Streptomyces sp. JJ36 TaxID=2736645 RepID=UPI001F3783A9|nr:DUF2637 domain-containing protein [Streptomyces sp. JJ36]MCF6525513.1 DUF2637 domain-containing protein [Streptomyces sp. JJ36]